MLTVTTSWDDGDILDKRLSVMLDKYGIKGTFYISKDYRPLRLSDADILDLSRRHEIGAHTLSHPDLRTLGYGEQKAEMLGSKRWLESIVGAGKVPMFCYPSGRIGTDSELAAKDSGFIGARTTEYGDISAVADPFLMKTTVHAYPMPFRKKGAHSYAWRKLFQPYIERAPAFRKLGVPFMDMLSWEKLVCAAFDIALEKGEVFHLWGHSWEIDAYGMWDGLERVLAYIGGRSDCEYLTNGAIIHRHEDTRTL